MSEKKSDFNYNQFRQGFTGTRFTDGTKRSKRKRPETVAEAQARRDRMNAKYDHNGNLR